MINKGVCNKRFIWNPSNCECKCEKLCDVGEYLDYINCKCRKRLVDKLAEEWIENVEEVKPAKNENKHKCSSCTLYIVLFSIIFMIKVGIGTYFVYFKYINCDKKNWCWRKVLIFKQQLLNGNSIKLINEKYQRNRH